MIPFASQRGHGQDLATHLQNAHDNEYVEMSDLRGAIAEDLHGAFAEWEAQASAMTKCKNYLYSLSVNPDDRQRPLPRELYADYVDRVEIALGLQDQPRAIVYHIKEGREHAHVVWSRIDVQEMKAVHMAFDHEKLMGVTRSFAREHGIELAPGYHRIEERKRQTYRQLSLADKAQQDEVGITREERSAVISDLWKRRDTPAAFLTSLEHSGYLLAHGRRPFVLVDIYGCTNSLPKLIDDMTVTTKAIRDFLGEAGDKEALPTVEEAKALTVQHRAAMRDVKINEDRTAKREDLAKRQEIRRAEFEKEADGLKARQAADRRFEAERHAQENSGHSDRYNARLKIIRDQREAARPTGLSGFLARVSGVALLRTKVHGFQDRKREAAHVDEQQRLATRQAADRLELQNQQRMQSLDMERKRRALEQIEKRERQSLEKAIQREALYNGRGGQIHAPSLTLDLKPLGRRAAPYKAMKRHTGDLAREMALAKQKVEKEIGTPKLRPAFEHAAKEARRHKEVTESGKAQGHSDPQSPDQAIRGYRRKRSGPENDRER